MQIDTDKRPHGSPRWVRLGPPPRYPDMVIGSTWKKGPLAVVSALENHSGKMVFHVSASLAVGLPSDEQMALVRKCFGMADAEEDNRAARTARHLWLDAPAN